MVLEGKRDVKVKENKLLRFSPNAYCLLDNNNSIRNKNESTQSVSVRLLRSGASDPVQSSLPGIINATHQALWPADYLVLSGALGKPCIRVQPVMHA
jgi:hypothetical protein